MAIVPFVTCLLLGTSSSAGSFWFCVCVVVVVCFSSMLMCVCVEVIERCLLEAGGALQVSCFCGSLIRCACASFPRPATK